MPQKESGSRSSNSRLSIAGGYLLIIITAMAIYVLDKPLGSLPAIGRLIDPIHGCWANSEAAKKDFNETLQIAEINKNATVWFDDRLVPHIHADNDHDLYFLQGYVHASFRLWQMDMQTRAAAGRVSEILGDQSFDFDRKQRRKGMLYAAENSLKAAETNPVTRLELDAYTAGVNKFIATLQLRDYPLEYKLMGFVPEPWTNLKSVLLLKYMADDLSGKTDDMAHSYLRSILSADKFNYFYPNTIKGSSPVIPAGTTFDKPSLAIPTAPPDSIAFPVYTTDDFSDKRESGKGSNNWALSGSRTASGSPILCNDPHLALNLPSLWYECQLMAPGINVYGASLPGAPGVVIGFNDSLTWGLTNNYRDVKDFYEIHEVDGNPAKYLMDGQELKYDYRIETIKIKGKPDYIDSVRYTVHGPLMYEKTYNEEKGLRRPLAVAWMGHRGSNEHLAIYKLNRATNYNQFVEAILHFECPAQNMLYADSKGNIALWGQGQYVNKWKDQGRFVMNGSTGATLWKELIPMSENPHALNPEQGYLCSANQAVTDSTYPYWYNGDFIELRAWRINEMLQNVQKATVQDMFAMQNDDYSILAAKSLPIMLSYCNDIKSSYLDTLRKWNYKLTATGQAATIFQLWWRKLYSAFWMYEFYGAPDYTTPLPERTMQLMLEDRAATYFQIIKSAKAKSLAEMVILSYKATADSLAKQEKSIGLQWYKAKNTSVTHLTRLPAFSYKELKTGGWGNTINAMKGNHGPSWRMVVQMGTTPEAFGVYPGGQSGNPGSRHYGEFVSDWAEGKYYPLLLLPNAATQNSSKIRHTWNFNSGKR